MLQSLHLKNFVLVAQADISFATGFTVLTGETGAGKSILLDAIQFVLGARADTGLIRHTADRLEVTAVFAANAASKLWLTAEAISDEGEGEVMIRRTLDAQGKQRSTINGTPVTAQQLRDLGALCLDIHGQHASQQLLKPNAQRALLDEFAQHTGLLQEVAQAWQVWQAAQTQLQQAQADADNNEQARAATQWLVDSLTSAAPTEGEWAKLEQEHKRLSHAAQLITGVEQAMFALDEADESINSQLDAVKHQISQLSRLDDGLKNALDTLEIASVNVAESASSLAQYHRQLELDPEQLATVESRIALLHSTARKHRLQPDELHLALAEAQNKLTQLQASANIAALAEACTQAQQSYDAVANQLSQSRQAAAHTLGQQVSHAMQDLALAGGQFAVQLQPQQPSAHGIDAVELMVSSNPGSPLKPLAKVASGGELSRISLAISVITSSQSQLPTLIFDEVDAGIGGAVASQVGNHMRQLSRHCQVMAVTHLPQVAAYAHQQLQVSKTVQDGQTLSHIVQLSAAERVDEIARMLGGAQITVTTKYHAQELLNQALDTQLL